MLSNCGHRGNRTLKRTLQKFPPAFGIWPSLSVIFCCTDTPNITPCCVLPPTIGTVAFNCLKRLYCVYDPCVHGRYFSNKRYSSGKSLLIRLLHSNASSTYTAIPSSERKSLPLRKNIIVLWGPRIIIKFSPISKTENEQ